MSQGALGHRPPAWRCRHTQPGTRRFTSPGLGSETCDNYTTLALGNNWTDLCCFRQSSCQRLRQEALGGAQEDGSSVKPALHPSILGLLNYIHSSFQRKRKEKDRKEKNKLSGAGTGAVRGLSPAGVVCGPRGHSGSGTRDWARLPLPSGPERGS